MGSKTQDKVIIRKECVVRNLTRKQRSEDIKAFGRELRKSKKDTLAFLQEAGILDKSGKLAKPYRS